MMTEPSIARSLITPYDQTLRKVFNAERSYYIDIYQREYKWTVENVKTLLNDIEVRFLQHDFRRTNPKEIQEDVLERFEPYFLNTFLTHTTAANTSIVDGQQRLTSILLIFIKLYRILRGVEQNPEFEHKVFSSETLKRLIFEVDDFGGPERFKIFNENREDAFRALIEGRDISAIDETRKRMRENYAAISDYLDTFLSLGDSHDCEFVRLNYYLTYLLDRISIVEIHIERQDNVAMIFEVVNDRGLGLKPYEILKGKLIGGLPTEQKERANKAWTELQDKYYSAELANTTEKTIDLDTFFRAFFRAKFADTEIEYERFEGDYHYEIYRNSKVSRYFGDFKDHNLLYRRITEDFQYFAELYYRLRTAYEEEYLIFNKLLDQNQQYLLLLSSIIRSDPEEKEKIRAIARKFDQIHVILRLMNAYDSNEFQRLIYSLNTMIRERSIAEAIEGFDRVLTTALEDAGLIAEGQHKEARELFEYERFKSVSNKWTNFSKYVLMRIDRYLACELDKPSFTSADLRELEARFNRTGNKIHGMHLEHIYTQHPSNKLLFTIAGVFDESAFQSTRNLLGMVLLLKDKHNLSSNDDLFADKQDTYRKSNLIWNELLVGHLQEVDARNLPSDLQLKMIEPNSEGVFPLDKVEERQKAVYIAIRHLWGTF
jgi:uncharacterized protein with ParB-like and HNH nuclease domain